MRYAFVLLVLLCGSLQAAEQVRLTNGELPPCQGERLPHQGVASRIIAEAFALQGIDVQWEFHPLA
ncbi:MAG TPA: amino acid ABC transporter substrate-binding protein, partial [Pseudomonas sp.]|nr:amino acid ABC transporter substrate-binding protein [Pseudomonas sp.]